MGSHKAILCPHGILGKRKCRECRLDWERTWVEKGNNREKGRVATRKWRIKNPDACRARTRRLAGIPVEHGIAPESTCPICNEYDTLVPDHDHYTKKLRGWICGRCNRALGYYEATKPVHDIYEQYLNGLVG